MRVPELSYDELAPEQKDIFDEIVAGPRGRVNGPFLVWLHRHELLRRGQALGLYCRFNSGLAPRLSELTILIVSSHWGAANEWHDHSGNAVKLGVDADALEALRVGSPAEFKQEDERALYAFVSELLKTHKFSDQTYKRAVEIFGQDLVIDLVGIVGYYCLIAMTLNVFEVPLPEGVPDPLAKKDVSPVPASRIATPR
jgi:4-carboxymuconolactone decarboxylase